MNKIEAEEKSLAQVVEERMKAQAEAEKQRFKTEEHRLEACMVVLKEDHDKVKGAIPKRWHSDTVLITNTAYQLGIDPCPETNRRILMYEMGLGHVETVEDEEGNFIRYELTDEAENCFIESLAYKIWVDELPISYRSVGGKGMSQYVEALKAHVSKEDVESLMEQKYNLEKGKI